MDNKNIAIEFTRTFNCNSGKRVLEYLKSITLERYLSPQSTNEELRYLEGQRYLISFITNMIKRGESGG